MAIKKEGDTYYIRFQLHGQRIRKVAGKSRKKALTLETALRKEIEDDYHNKRLGRSSSHLFNEALQKWLVTDAPASMKSHIRNILPYTEGVLLKNSLTAVEGMREHAISKGLAVSTINRRLSVFRRVLRLAHTRWDMLDVPLHHKIEAYSEKGLSRKVFLSLDEAIALAAAIERDSVRMVVIGFMVSGLRRSELLNLKDGDFIDGEIDLSKQKGKKTTRTPIPEQFHFVFENLPFNVTTNQLRWDWEKAQKLMNMEHVRVHDLRHTYVSWLIQDPNTPVFAIQGLARHSSILTTQTYTHLRKDAKTNAAASLGDNVKRLTELLDNKRH